jgi:hypothetical protein
MTLRLERIHAFNSTAWQRHCENLEAANADLQSQITAIAAAQAAATAAATAATAAQTTADVVKRNDKISASLTTPTSILSASDAGASATITVANHVRKYGDATTLSVTGGSITALAYTTAYAVYYDDTTTSVAAPTFLATTTLKDGQFNAAAGRHYCGQVTTPAAAGAPTAGDGPRGTGGGGPYP